MFNTDQIKNDFPVFRHYPDLIFTDNASTTQKPKIVIDAINNCYTSSYANIHRAVYDLGIKSDEIYRSTKRKILRFYDLSNDYEVIYTHGTTDGLNKLAFSIEKLISPGDNIVISEMEHHSNLLPWQELCKRKGCELRIIPFDEEGNLELIKATNLIDNHTKVLSITHISNTLGTINDLQKISGLLNENTIFIVDAAQSASFYTTEIKESNADFIVASGHKIFGPSGIGFILIKKNKIEHIYPFHFGGGMVIDVEPDKSIYKEDIGKFEAGTPPIAQIAGLGAAFDYLSKLNLEQCKQYVFDLSSALRDALKDEVVILGNPEKYSGVISLYIDDIHPHDAATFLNSKNIAVRAGHHCTQLIMKKYNIPASVRFSMTIYNSQKEIDTIISAFKAMKKYFL